MGWDDCERGGNGSDDECVPLVVRVRVWTPGLRTDAGATVCLQPKVLVTCHSLPGKYQPLSPPVLELFAGCRKDTPLAPRAVGFPEELSAGRPIGLRPAPVTAPPGPAPVSVSSARVRPAATARPDRP